MRSTSAISPLYAGTAGSTGVKSVYPTDTLPFISAPGENVALACADVEALSRSREYSNAESERDALNTSVVSDVRLWRT